VAARHLLHEAVDEKPGLLRVPCRQRIGREIGERFVQIFALGSRDHAIEQEFRHRFGDEPGEPLQ
jgi:hypothetical protein